MDRCGRVSELNKANLRKLERGEVVGAVEASDEDFDDHDLNIDDDEDDMADFDVDDEDGQVNDIEGKLNN